jgi:hypothetical protein
MKLNIKNPYREELWGLFARGWVVDDDSLVEDSEGFWEIVGGFDVELIESFEGFKVKQMNTMFDAE